MRAARSPLWEHTELDGGFSLEQGWLAQRDVLLPGHSRPVWELKNNKPAFCWHQLLWKALAAGCTVLGVLLKH